MVEDEEPVGIEGRWAARSALRYALVSAPGTILAAVAIGWSYSELTEFDRPSPVGALPFLGAQALWCVGAVLAVHRDDVDTRPRSLAVRLASIVAVLGLASLLAPPTPIPQGAVLLGVSFVLPTVVATALAWQGPLVAVLRAVVGGAGVVIGVPAALLVLLVAATRAMSIPLAASFAALVAHLPVTFVTTVVRANRSPDGEPAPPMRGRPAVALTPLVLFVAALAGVGGIAARPLSPHEDDPLLAEVAAAHRDLNSAVGWDSWRPRALEKTAATLDRAVTLSDEAPEMIDAAARVREALAHDDRDAAVAAHRIVAGFELNVREARRLLAEMD